MGIYLICYDIVDDRERDRVARWLEQHGRRVQDSVFELHRIDASARKRLVEALRKRVSNPASVRLYRISRAVLSDCTDLAGTALATRPAMIIL